MRALLKKIEDTINMYRLPELLETNFNETKAYKLGIIDEKGNRNKNITITTTEQRNAYSPLHKLVFNVKKLFERKKSLASHASALYLMKEKFSLSEKKIEKLLYNIGLDVTDFIIEDCKWFVLPDNRLSPGMYKLSHAKVVNSTLDELAKANEYISVDEKCYPVGSMFGINIYEVTHVRSRQKVYVTTAELKI